MTRHDADPASPTFIATLRELAESAARVGGQIARQSFGERQQVTLKHDRSEVTEVDLAAERAVVEHIRAQRPQDAFIGEESTGSDPNRQSSIRNPQSTIWVIDPIDGTRNYIRRIPVFACSVAAVCDGTPVAGAVYDPVQDVMYSAGRQQGAFVDGRRISLVDADRPSTSDPQGKLFVGIPSARRQSTRRFVLHAIERHIVRNLGAAALHLAMLASGQLDVVVVGNSKLWDIAAGWLLAIEAGGVVTSPDGKPVFPLDISRYAGEDIPILGGNPTAYARFVQGVATG